MEEQYNHLEQNPLAKSNYKNAILLGFQFLLMFSAFNSASNMIALLYEQSGNQNLGVISLIVLYLAFGIANIFAPNICAKFNPKYVLAISNSGYTLYIASGILVSLCQDDKSGICSKSSIYSIVIFTAALCGIGASTLWVSQSWYISNISTIETRGKFFGTFWGIMQSSQIVGNALGLVLLSSAENASFLYFLILTIISGISGASFLLLPNPPPKEQDTKNLSEKIKGMFMLIASKKMRPLLFYYFFAGSIVAFYTGFLYKLIQGSLPDDDEDTVARKSATVFIVLGFFEFLGGFVSGYVSDRANRYLVATGSTIIVELAIVLSIICYYQKSYALCFVDAALWGLSDCIVQNMCTVITSTLFPDQIEGFAVSKLTQSIAISLVLITGIFLENEIIFIMIIAAVEIITNVSTAKLGVKGEKMYDSK